MHDCELQFTVRVIFDGYSYGVTLPECQKQCLLSYEKVDMCKKNIKNKTKNGGKSRRNVSRGT
jgi:hypothetical protein